jgi:hypothetical protein
MPPIAEVHSSGASWFFEIVYFYWLGKFNHKYCEMVKSAQLFPDAGNRGR